MFHLAGERYGDKSRCDFGDRRRRPRKRRRRRSEALLAGKMARSGAGAPARQQRPHAHAARRAHLADGPGPGVTGPMTDRARKTRPGMTDAQARLDDMDLEGIDVAILFGTQVALTVNGLMNGEFAAALCRAVNEWLLEY